MGDIWSFSLRSNCGNNSDSESGDDDQPPTDAASEESRLLKEFDITQREETVHYKPNPFSIAKINAAARSHRRSSITEPSHSNVQAPQKKLPVGRIVDSFAERKSSISAGASQADDSVCPTSILDDFSPPMNSTSTHVPSQVSNVCLTVDRNASSLAAAPPLAPSSLPTRPIAHSFQPVSPMHIPAFSAHLEPTPSSFTRPTKSSIAPFSSPLKTPAVIQVRRPGAARQRFFSSPPSAAARSSGSVMHTLFRKRERIPLPKRKSPPIAGPRYDSNPSALLLGPSEQESSADLPGRHVNQHRNQFFAQHAQVGPVLTPAFEETSSCPSEHRRSPSDPVNPIKKRFTPAFENSPKSPLFRARSPPSPASIPRASLSKQKSRTSVRSSGGKHKREPVVQASRTDKRDAYDYFPADPDEEWTTLSSRRKGKIVEPTRSNTQSIQTSAAFRLPLLGKGRKTGMTANSERRVVTFFPPPLQSGPVDVVVEKVGSHIVETNKRVRRDAHKGSPPISTPKRRRLSDNPYPSPPTSRLAPGDASMLEETAGLPTSSPGHAMLSPPTSDPIQEAPGDGQDVRKPITVRNVLQRYVYIRNAMQE